MIQPKQAAVRPRVESKGGATALLEDEIRALVEAGATGKVGIFGGPGSGKTTALAHLAAVLPPDAGCVFRDEPAPALVMDNVESGLCIIAARSSTKLGFLRARYAIKAWTRDDVIEYLLATHKERCASVLYRFSAEDVALLEGLPQLCQIACDELARDESVPDVATALRRCVANELNDEELAERASIACLESVAVGNPLLLLHAALPAESYDLLRHRPVELMLATDGLVELLRRHKKPHVLGARLPRDLVLQASKEVQDDKRSLEGLQRLLTGRRGYQPMAASILHCAGALPATLGRKVNLRRAYLDGAALRNMRLVRADLREADLSYADLRNANCAKASFDGACLSGARLEGAVLVGSCLNDADLSDADLSMVKADDAFFDRADLSQAHLERAALSRASLIEANLEGACFVNANLSHAALAEAELAGADFTDARLDGAQLIGSRLREAAFRGASFARADLTDCDLENTELPDVNFSRANLSCAMLSDSVMRGADFSWANLSETGLADIDWQGASLRKADLRGATFHMGGSRSGLVGSPIASEGSRTGFYTDEFEEQHFKSPEEIRKANLCGVDLRGALIDGVDFYLVDLRGAKYDPEQEPQLRRSGAILQARV